MLGPDDLQFLWLPLSHVFGEELLAVQLQIGFATAIDGRVDKIVENMAVVKPTFMGAAPRIFEKAHARIVTMMESEGGVKAKLFDWAFGVGAEVSELRQAGQGAGRCAGRAVRGGRQAGAVEDPRAVRWPGPVLRLRCGGAGQELAQWFHSAGLLIIEGYGLTETAAGTA